MSGVELPIDVVQALYRGEVIEIQVNISARVEDDRLRIDADITAPEALGTKGCIDLVTDGVARLVTGMGSQ